MIVVVMPRLSDSMEEGTIVRWLKADGDSVERGDELLEIEADKATETHASEHAGRLVIVVPEGRTLPIGATIAELHDDAPAQEEPAEAPPREGGTAKGEVTVTEPGRAQQQIARRVAESRATIPALTLRATIDMGASAELLAGLAGSPAPPGYTDLVVRACGLALAEHPIANGAYRDGHFERYARVNVGLVVDVPGGLLTPTIFDANDKTIEQIAAESRSLTRTRPRRHDHVARARRRHVHGERLRCLRGAQRRRGDRSAACRGARDRCRRAATARRR